MDDFSVIILGCYLIYILVIARKFDFVDEWEEFLFFASDGALVAIWIWSVILCFYGNETTRGLGVIVLISSSVWGGMRINEVIKQRASNRIVQHMDLH
jgi:hypothetical protein